MRTSDNEKQILQTFYFNFCYRVEMSTGNMSTHISDLSSDIHSGNQLEIDTKENYSSRRFDTIKQELCLDSTNMQATTNRNIENMADDKHEIEREHTLTENSRNERNTEQKNDDCINSESETIEKTNNSRGDMDTVIEQAQLKTGSEDESVDSKENKGSLDKGKQLNLKQLHDTMKASWTKAQNLSDSHSYRPVKVEDSDSSSSDADDEDSDDDDKIVLR